ncbi:cation diffusion facilitator family transporter [Flavihumibacter stibioxidans]|uniref:Cation transporter n=1 Tax=Flavihumibacter stibioxidans TaxID=1834163 RepID=A0ABR7M9U7_9BACT|nr:cation diffusion facilitator family transporter [Flavihumibacter stibioxidans]MBC6491304.1 cation transporter [Flavihumibacter stibioxidans]
MAEHNHSHTTEIKNLNRAFIIGIILNTLFVIVEAISGLYYHSVALLSDAGHNLSDVASLLLALFAYRLAKTKTTSTFTYGYRKSTVLVSLINAIVLLIAVGSILWESISRLNNPEIINGKNMAIVAGVGIVINTITALLFLKGRKKDLNIKGAYLHMAADALVSAGVVIAGILIAFTGWYWLDGAIGILIALMILLSTISLLRDSIILSMDAVPKGISLPEVKKKIESVIGVVSVHHLHIWAISTTYNAMTAHVVISDKSSMPDLTAIKKEIRHRLEHLNIEHSTLEFEINDGSCMEGI